MFVLPNVIVSPFFDFLADVNAFISVIELPRILARYPKKQTVSGPYISQSLI